MWAGDNKILCFEGCIRNSVYLVGEYKHKSTKLRKRLFVVHPWYTKCNITFV